MKSHAVIDARGLRLAREIAARIDADPARAGLVRARQVCARWRAAGVPGAAEWQSLLEEEWANVRRRLLSDDEDGCRLRQNSPFCGILSPRERWKIFKEFPAL